MRLLPLALVLALAVPVAAQRVYDTADPMPVMVGGLEALQAAITYPDEAREARIAGRVIVTFVVDAEGRVAEAEILRGAHPLLDEAALTAIREARFEPGRLQGTPVAVRMALPITFVLDERAEAAPTEATPADEGTNGEAEPADDPETAPPPPATVQVDRMPEIVGGLDALVARVVYPPEAEAAGIEGRVYVLFEVDERGAVTAAEVVEPVHPLLDAAALEAVRATTFRPGAHDGRPVRVQMVLPITFSLPEED